MSSRSSFDTPSEASRRPRLTQWFPTPLSRARSIASQSPYLPMLQRPLSGHGVRSYRVATRVMNEQSPHAGAYDGLCAITQLINMPLDIVRLACC